MALTLAARALAIWAQFTGVTYIYIMSVSLAVFCAFYIRPTYNMWRRKTNPKYPTVRMVRTEILQVTKNMPASTIMPTFSVLLVEMGRSRGYWGFLQHGIGYDVFQLLFIMLSSDVFQWWYHRISHSTRWGWNKHKAHHKFFNPSPFATVADEPWDQCLRSLPMFVLPLLMPISMEIMFIENSMLFYSFGVYQHWGFEFDWLDAHNPVINTSYHHYIHHTKSTANKPYHTAFFLRLWDDLAGSVYAEQPCACAKCCRAMGLRSRAAFDKIVKPDYSELLSLGAWTSTRRVSRRVGPDIEPAKDLGFAS